MKYNMGHPEQGFSYEHYNFYDTLVRMKHEVIYFPYDEIMLKVGKKEMNEQLLDKVKEENPELCFFELINHQISRDTIKRVTGSGKTTTFNWFSDDSWRFDIFSKYYAKLFDWVSTTDLQAIPKYHKIGYRNVIRSQWGCNSALYRPAKSVKKFEHDVTFVGKAYGNRPYLISLVRDAKINVECWGNGWPNGRISQEDMTMVFSKSKINLNLSKEQKNLNSTYILGTFFNREITGHVRPNDPREWVPRVKYLIKESRNQMKGRLFEIPGCGGFMLTEHTDNIEDYYVEGREIATFYDESDLIEKIQYYLKEKNERISIAKAGYKRTMKDHTYEKRFNYIFKHMGL
jgi:spore maturation protein CgeB